MTNNETSKQTSTRYIFFYFKNMFLFHYLFHENCKVGAGKHNLQSAQQKHVRASDKMIF